MNQSGYNINDLVQEAQTRWLKPAEVLFILQNHESDHITDEHVQKPPSGSLFLFNKRVLRFFRQDGHIWRKKKNGRTVGEGHERLKVGNVETLNCYYAHGEQNPYFQRRSYWMLDPAHDHIVLVHYRDINEGRQNSIPNILQLSSASAIHSQNPDSNSTARLGSSVVFSGAYERYRNMSSPGSVEINSDPFIRSSGVDHSDAIEKAEDADSSPSLEISQALKLIEEQLSLDEDSLPDFGTFSSENENSVYFDNAVCNRSPCSGMHLNPNVLPFLHHPGGSTDNLQSPGQEASVWKEVLSRFESSQNIDLQAKHVHKLDENGLLLAASGKESVEEYGCYNLLDFGGDNARQSSSIPREVIDFNQCAYPSAVSTKGTNPDDFTKIFDQGQTGDSLEDLLPLTLSPKQKFRIQEISPEWGYASDATKVIIIGSFLCDPSDSTWTCMFGDIEVPVQIIQEGVLRCLAPPNFVPGKVTLCVTSGNRESCSEVREFEYRVKSTVCPSTNQSNTDPSQSPEELLLLVRFVHMLLSESQVQKGDCAETGTNLLSKSRGGEDPWEQVLEAVSAGTWTSSITSDWLLQELLKDKLQQWLNSRSREDINQLDCSLTKKEQGIIHMIAGLGYEWALQPILKSGVSVNFRDINGWAPLHWAARFGREKIVAALIALGASAGAVTDPNPEDLVGKTPASVAATYGHTGLAGYLSEMALTSHLSSLTFEESELSKGSADVEAERTISSIPQTSPSTNADQLSLKESLAAVRNATQAAACIQSAFRAHSFRKRLQREAAETIASVSINEYNILDDVQGLSAASKLAFHSPRDYNSAAVSIQKKYRGWKGRKDFLAFRQKVVKIQAHIRGYQVRKQYHVSWAVSVLEKIVLRWLRRGAGLRGYRYETETIDESEDEHILRLFRKKKVDAALNEAVSRVLLMVENPEAREQYRRILEIYRQAKAELDAAGKEKEQSSNDGFFFMENDGNYEFT